MQLGSQADPRGRILEVVDRLFYQEGVRAIGTERIMAEASVAKATFYRYFQSKDALVFAYLENRDRALWEFLGPPTTLREMLMKFEHWANRPEVVGCPFLRIATEFPDTSHPFHRAATAHQNKLRSYIAALLGPSLRHQERVSAAILSVIDGALTLRMLYGTSQHIEITATAEAVLALCGRIATR